MKKLLFSLMVVLASLTVSDAKNHLSLPEINCAEWVGVSCADWAVGFIEAYETYSGADLDSGTWSVTFSNLMDHCASTTGN